MRNSPRQFDSQQDLYSAALRALMRRAHSVHEMKDYLERRAPSKDLIAPVIARLKEQKYLDDARYALDFARLHAVSRRQGRFRIARELRARGVPGRHIEAALDAVFAQADEASLIRARLQRRLARLRAPLDKRGLASLYRSLLAAGFSADAIRAELRSITREDLPEVPDSPDES